MDAIKGYLSSEIITSENVLSYFVEKLCSFPKISNFLFVFLTIS